MSNNKDTAKTLFFVALAALMVGAVAATVIAYSNQADAVRPARPPTCPEKDPDTDRVPPCGFDITR